ncbi:hypothetical protein [Nocardiopsis sp. SBT366]|uniref:hypothetical protein n=1 Tax=Nocardiopsis sp. SBT366 TaxID=1580529 RepID=UPI000AC86A2B|nr:hypothetical protein [Nocardiopsis sp. SBT366]
MAAPNPGPRRRRTHVDPRELRPSRTWFWVGGTLLTLSLVAGTVLFALLSVRAVALPEFAASTQGSQSATFTVPSTQGTEQGWLLYGSPRGVDHTACTLTAPDGGHPVFAYPTFNHQVEEENRSWAMIGTATLTQPGEYTLTCQGTDDVRFGIAPGAQTTGTLVTGLFGALGSLLLLPALGVSSGLALIVVTAVRRQHHRERLLHPPRQRP